MIGFFLNEGRILYKIFQNDLHYIKTKIIIKELGYSYLVLIIFLNFFKGYMLFFIFGGYSIIYDLLLAFSILIGLYLGSKPVNPEGSELLIILGIIASYDFEIVKMAFALFLGILILLKKVNLALGVFVVLNLFCLFKNQIFLGFFALLLLVNYVRYNNAQFFTFWNRINKNFILPFFKGVKSSYESLLYTITKTS